MILEILAAEGPNGKFLPSDIKEFWWSTAAFLVVVLLLTWKVLPLIKGAMAKRSDGIRESLVEAERSRVDAEAELASLRSKLSDSDEESGRIVEQARSQAAEVKADLMKRAELDAKEMLSKADEEVAASKGQATADVQSVVASQAVAAAESVVLANLDPNTHSELIDRYIDEVNAS